MAKEGADPTIQQRQTVQDGCSHALGMPVEAAKPQLTCSLRHILLQPGLKQHFHPILPIPNIMWMFTLSPAAVFRALMLIVSAITITPLHPAAHLPPNSLAPVHASTSTRASHNVL